MDVDVGSDNFAWPNRPILTTLSFADIDLVSNFAKKKKKILQHTVIRKFVYIHNNGCLGDEFDPDQLCAGV